MRIFMYLSQDITAQHGDVFSSPTGFNWGMGIHFSFVMYADD
ncbi:MAG: hypothetical protein ACLFR1_13900 [Spirochaetia bacterium]